MSNDELRDRFAALDPDSQLYVFAYLAGRCPEYAAEALRLNERWLTPGESEEQPRAAGG